MPGRPATTWTSTASRSSSSIWLLVVRPVGRCRSGGELEQPRPELRRRVSRAEPYCAIAASVARLQQNAGQDFYINASVHVDHETGIRINTDGIKKKLSLQDSDSNPSPNTQKWVITTFLAPRPSSCKSVSEEDNCKTNKASTGNDNANSQRKALEDVKGTHQH